MHPSLQEEVCVLLLLAWEVRVCHRAVCLLLYCLISTEYPRLGLLHSLVEKKTSALPAMHTWRQQGVCVRVWCVKLLLLLLYMASLAVFCVLSACPGLG